MTDLAAKPCARPCSECSGSLHHWLEPEHFVAVSDIPLEHGCVDVDDMVALERCKHCPALRIHEASL